VISAAVMVPLTLVVGTLVGLLLSRLGRRMATFVSSVSVLAWATPAVSASVIFAWLANPDGGVIDWSLSKLPHWLGGGAHWAGFSWTNAALPAYTLTTVLVVWTSFPFIAISLLRPIFQVLFLLSVIWDFGVFTQVFIIIGELGQRDEYNLGIYEYATAFQLPPAYGLASALAFILTIVLLIVTVGYVRASVKEGALH
jgi:N,N'-diacetylchitobiose transport system permease protein